MCTCMPLKLHTASTIPVSNARTPSFAHIIGSLSPHELPSNPPVHPFQSSNIISIIIHIYEYTRPTSLFTHLFSHSYICIYFYITHCTLHCIIPIPQIIYINIYICIHITVHVKCFILHMRIRTYSLSYAAMHWL